MQADAIQPGQNVVIIDDLVATGACLKLSFLTTGDIERMHIRWSGGSAKAAGELVAKLGAKTLEYLFIIELTFLKPAEKLDAPLYSIIQVDD